MSYYTLANKLSDTQHDPADKELAGGSVYFRGTATVNTTRDTRWIGRFSYYVLHGDWFVGACMGFATFAYLIARFSKVPQKPKEEEA